MKLLSVLPFKLNEVDFNKKDKSKHPTGKVKITIEANDSEGSLYQLLSYLQELGNMGHSFSIVVDPDMSEYKRNFGWDGDGPDRISSISIKKSEGK